MQPDVLHTVLRIRGKLVDIAGALGQLEAAAAEPKNIEVPSCHVSTRQVKAEAHKKHATIAGANRGSVLAIS